LASDINKVEPASISDFEEITQVWEASVRATHHFLNEGDISFYKSFINEYLHAVNLFCIKDEQGSITGFLGTAKDKVEMLFIRPDCRGKSIGSTLLKYAVEALNIRKVDVNEQNEQAAGFYLHFGFTVVERSEKDGMGKPYPVLKMELTI
jgi:putative acetyltransferase